MTRGRTIALVALALLLGAAFAVTFVLLPQWYLEPTGTQTRVQPSAAPATPRIKARLFYVSEDGQHLVGMEREIPFGEGTLMQARRIVEAQLERPAPPVVSAIPEGTKLRAIHLGATGEAFVDLSREASAAHPGGTFGELLTVYSIVNAVTENLPAVRSVQILVDGHEVDTLAGHVDLRQPLHRGASWILEPPPRDPARQD
jgi:hypothetical protein